MEQEISYISSSILYKLSYGARNSEMCRCQNIIYTLEVKNKKIWLK